MPTEPTLTLPLPPQRNGSAATPQPPTVVYQGATNTERVTSHESTNPSGTYDDRIQTESARDAPTHWGYRFTLPWRSARVAIAVSCLRCGGTRVGDGTLP